MKRLSLIVAGISLMSSLLYCQFPSTPISVGPGWQYSPSLLRDNGDQRLIVLCWLDHYQQPYGKLHWGTIGAWGGPLWTSGGILPPPPYPFATWPSAGKSNAWFLFGYGAHAGPPNLQMREIWVAKTQDFVTYTHVCVSDPGVLYQTECHLVSDNNSRSTYKNRLYCIWLDASQGTSIIRFRYSQDGGSTWIGSSPEVLDQRKERITDGDLVFPRTNDMQFTPPTIAEQVKLPRLAVGPDGEVYAAWIVQRNGSYTGSDLLVSKSTNGGAGFGDPIIAAKDIGTYLHSSYHNWNWCTQVTNIPTIAVASRGDVYVAYSTWSASGDERPQIVLRCSQNGGLTWNTVNFPNPNVSNFMPSLSIDSKTRISLSFTHENENANVATFVAFSKDNGSTFTVKQVSGFFDPYGGMKYHTMGSGSEGLQNKTFVALTDKSDPNTSEDILYANLQEDVVAVPAIWNMTGIPNFLDSYSKSSVYPGVPPGNIWIYNPSGSPPGYQVAVDPLTDYMGYWINFPAAQQVSYLGVSKPTMDMIVGRGWNIIGSISRAVDAQSVVQIPPGTLGSSYWKYQNGGYVITTSLEPGWGYWVKCNNQGVLRLSYPVGLLKGNSGAESTQLDSFYISDQYGHVQVLTVQNGGANQEMPPDPPVGAFNVRFANGNFLQAVSPGQGTVPIPVHLASVTYPVTVSWDFTSNTGISYWLRTGTRRDRISNSGSITINRRVDGLVRLEAQATGVGKRGAESLPTILALRESYPNPFNPSTDLRFDLPDAATVSLIIYDLLGRKVTELANGNYEAGYHSVTWNASDLASGVYLARFNVVNQLGNVVYTKTNKLVLMK